MKSGEFHLESPPMSQKKSVQLDSTPLTPLITRNLLIVLITIEFGTYFQYYSNSVVNNILKLGQLWFKSSFLLHYGYGLREIDIHLLWSFSSGALQIGAIFGAMLVRYLAETWGRRKSLMGSGLLSSFGTGLAVIGYYVNCFEIFILGRFVIGISLSIGTGVSSMFINEIAPIRYRGACGAVQQLFIGFGNFTSLVLTLPQILGKKHTWIIAVGVPIVCGIVQIIILYFTYDTPRYLILTKNKRDKGTKAIKFYRGRTYTNSTLKTIEHEMEKFADEENVSWKDFWTNVSLRRPLIIALVVTFGVQSSGIGPIMAYSKQMFTDAGLDSMTAQVATVGIGCCTFLSPLLAMFLVEKAGRKKLYLGGLSTCFVAMTLFVICAEISLRYKNRVTQLSTIPCMYVYQMGFSIASSIVWIVPAELFPQYARSNAMTIILFFLWVFQAVTILAYLPFKDAVGVSFSFIPFLICIAGTILYLIFYMPETRGKSVDEISEMFMNNVNNKECKFAEEEEEFETHS